MSIERDRLPAEGRIRLAELQPFTGLSRSSIIRKINAGVFPKPVRLTSHCSLFDLAEVNAWLRDPVGYRAPSEAAGGAK